MTQQNEDDDDDDDDVHHQPTQSTTATAPVVTTLKKNEEDSHHGNIDEGDDESDCSSVTGEEDGPENRYVRELFAFNRNADSDDDDEDDDDDDDDKNSHPLISHYVQSFDNINVVSDGGSGSDSRSDSDRDSHRMSSDNDGSGNVGVVDMHYYLALLARGHGNSVWNSSRCIAEHLMDDTKRRELFDVHDKTPQTSSDTIIAAADNYDDDDDDGKKDHRRTSRLSVLELGAGGALPSLAMLYVMMKMRINNKKDEEAPALRATKKKDENNHVDIDDVGVIVISDLVDTDGLTFEAIRKSIRRNIKTWGSSTLKTEAAAATTTADTNDTTGTTHDTDEVQKNVHIVSHVWGDSVDPLLDCINDRRHDGDTGQPHSQVDLSPTQQSRNKFFDVIIASDCIYNPTHHHALLSSVNSCLLGSDDAENSAGGWFVVGYSYHPNVPPEQVESFFDMASSPEFNLGVVFEKTVEYQEGQIGIGSTDPDRGTVYLKVLRRRKEKTNTL